MSALLRGLDLTVSEIKHWGLKVKLVERLGLQSVKKHWGLKVKFVERLGL